MSPTWSASAVAADDDMEKKVVLHDPDVRNEDMQEHPRHKSPVLKFLVGLESRIDKFAKFEAMGIERVPDDERKPPQILNVRAAAMQVQDIRAVTSRAD